MTISLRSVADLSRAAASALNSASSTKGWKPIPQINQLHPAGADQDYVNGAYNCAPAVVAMLARGYGKQSDLSDADLIESLGDGIVTEDGTDANGVARMLARADIPPAGEALGANYKDSELKQQLNQGHMMIARVRTSDPKGDQTSPHYVLVQGMTKDGNYIISDPLANKPYVATPAQLKQAVLKAPPDGGLLIPVSSPAEAKKAKAAAGTAPATGGKAAAVVQDPSSVAGTSAPKAAASTTAAKAAPVPVDTFEPPSPKAFTVADDAFEGVDTHYKAAPAKSNATMQANEQKNQFQLDVRYGDKTAEQPAPAAPVTPDDKDADQFAQEIRDRKGAGDLSAYDTLSQLEKSASDKDHVVLDKVKEADKKDPGIGKKTVGESF